MPTLIRGAAWAMQTERWQTRARVVQGWFSEFRTAKRRPRMRPPSCHFGAREARAMVRNCAP